MNCAQCGKALTRDEEGLSRKLINRGTKVFYCLDCLAEYLEVTPQDILDKIEEFKAEGCKLFE